MIKNIVFDMGGVLIDYNPRKTLDTYFPKKYHDVLFEEVFGNELWHQLDGGLLRYDDVIPKVLTKIPRRQVSLLKQC